MWHKVVTFVYKYTIVPLITTVTDHFSDLGIALSCLFVCLSVFPDENFKSKGHLSRLSLAYTSVYIFPLARSCSTVKVIGESSRSHDKITPTAVTARPQCSGGGLWRMRLNYRQKCALTIVNCAKVVGIYRLK